MPKKRIGILGGSFNPPHIAHLANAEYVREALQLDSIYLMPSALPPHKDGKPTLASEHRVKMVQLAIQDNPYLAMESYEVDQGGKNYTYNTIKVLKEKYGECELFFIIGGDMVEYLPTWYRIDELVKEVVFVGVYRYGSSLETDYPIKVVDIPSFEVSSSDIRQRVAKGQTIRYLVPESVRLYIEEKGLYRNVE